MKQVWRKVSLWGAGLALLAGGLYPSFSKRHEEQQRLAQMALQGKPWNGGKPTAPIELESTVEGEVPSNEWIDLRISLLPTAEGCVSLTSRARGLDEIEVSDDSLWTHPSCTVGDRIYRELRIRAPEGASGLLVMDLRMEMSSGDVFEVSRVVPLRAEGTPILPQKAESN